MTLLIRITTRIIILRIISSRSHGGVCTNLTWIWIRDRPFWFSFQLDWSCRPNPSPRATWFLDSHTSAAALDASWLPPQPCGPLLPSSFFSPPCAGEFRPAGLVLQPRDGPIPRCRGWACWFCACWRLPVLEECYNFLIAHRQYLILYSIIKEYSSKWPPSKNNPHTKICIIFFIAGV